MEVGTYVLIIIIFACLIPLAYVLGYFRGVAETSMTVAIVPPGQANDQKSPKAVYTIFGD